MTLAIVLYITICILAILIFLLQQTETGGMGIIGGASNTLLGATRTTFLGKVANFFAILFFISALFLSVLSSGENSLFQNQNLDELIEETVPNIDEETGLNSVTDTEAGSETPTTNQ